MRIYQQVKLENCLLVHMLQLISGCDTFNHPQCSFIWSLYASAAKKPYFCSRLACILQTSFVSDIDLVSLDITQILHSIF